MGSKKASLLDGIFVIVVAAAFALVSLVGYNIITDVNNLMQGSDMHTDAKEIMSSNTNKYVPLFDWCFMIILFMLFIGMIISSVFSDANPAWFFVSFILLIITIMSAGLMGNIFFDAVTSQELSSSISAFTYIPFVMEHYITITGALVIISFICLYVKTGS